MGQDRTGRGPHLFPVECFLTAEPPGQSPGSPNQEHLGEEALCRERRGVLQSEKAFGEQEGSPEGPCPWLSPILPPEE